MAQKVSYAWALLLEHERYRRYLDEVRASGRRQFVDTGRVPEHVFEADWNDAMRGLAYAQDLARAARARRAARILTPYERRGLAPEQRGLTPMELAKLRGVSLGGMTDSARRARWFLFRKRADRTIRHRLARWAEVNGRETRYCEVAGCTNELPSWSRTTRKRCDACRAAGRRTGQAVVKP